jgi:hypothetical protein
MTLVTRDAYASRRSARLQRDRTASLASRVLCAPGFRVVVIVLFACLAASTAAEATVAAPRSVLLGVYGPKARFAAATSSAVRVGHVILGWSQGLTWGAPLDQQFAANGPVPMIGLNTQRGEHESLTPLGLARGRGDRYLVALNHAISRWGRRVYIRPLAEMNASWNSYSAFGSDGGRRDSSHSTQAFRLAFARIYLLLHGGPGANGALTALGLPPVSQSLADNPATVLRVIWNPQGFGSPDVRGNDPESYYPGDRFVDVVGNDLYNMGGGAAWEANERLYRSHPDKPYAVPEWSNWGIDDPAFVLRMASFVRTHARVELIAYYNGRAGSTWDIASKPRTLAVYRSHVAPLSR